MLNRSRTLMLLTALAVGYMVVWTAVGLVAYVIADWFGSLAAENTDLATAIAVATFASVGIYQLTPLKFRCLRTMILSSQKQASRKTQIRRSTKKR